MSTSGDAVPLCPVTGLPAARRVQQVTTRLLTDLWRITFGVDARSSFRGVERLGLWESPTGLYFFDPPLEGDGQFYSNYYDWSRGRRSAEAGREEFPIAARHIRPGARVLDVGCGPGNFRHYIPQSAYTGIDPYPPADSSAVDIRRETLTQHLAARAGFYDAVCCFQVVEHVRDPKSLFAELVQAAKPGGLICVAVPHVPSAFTRIPNFLINAPPHHLTWWSKEALAELAKSAGAVVESIKTTPWGPEDSMIYWIERCSPFKCRDIHYRGAALWHTAALAGYLLGAVAFKLLGAPKGGPDEGAGLLMFARKADA